MKSEFSPGIEKLITDLAGTISIEGVDVDGKLRKRARTLQAQDSGDDAEDGADQESVVMEGIITTAIGLKKEAERTLKK